MTTVNEDGGANISPMGPIVDASMRELTLRPYQTSTTYQNLKRTGEGVFHATDNVLMLARSAVGAIDPPPPMCRADAVDGYILEDACRWYALRVRSLDDSQQRTRVVADVVDRGWQREFFGLNRAKHAVVEAAILATRIEFLPADDILSQFESLQVLVDKTGGADEREAFRFLQQYVAGKYVSSAGRDVGMREQRTL